ncbi:hypothetical protein DM02DRAFT_655157 [Periconia macrospinosa]|uniref:F-box domain-containing protein n=1 Tax=Periconia macrospinosa TaxID=97972 RepID=A0A2V1DS17_9PLEO|nr:hypothetical protein DM02DRAFT_655157 [Periconia macrospinosa]
MNFAVFLRPFLSVPLVFSTTFVLVLIAGAAVWSFRHFKTHSKLQQARTDHPPRFGTLHVPPEILLMIASHLDRPSLISFSLATRYLYGLSFPRGLGLNRFDKERLLVCLEKDFPGLYFCHSCVKLHSWHSEMRTWKFYPRRRSSCPEEGWHLGLVCLTSRNIYSYHEMRLFMNRHFYGPDHGPPLRMPPPNYTTIGWSPRYFGALCKKEETFTYRILDDRLMTFTTITYSSLRGDARALELYIDKTGPELCNHLQIGREGGRFILQLHELVKRSSGNPYPGLLTPCQKSFRSCYCCMTDYSIDITWVKGQASYVVSVSAWRDFGNFRSPWDWRWRNDAWRRSLISGRLFPTSSQGPGSVRKKWNLSNGIYDVVDGQWAPFRYPYGHIPRRMGSVDG